MSVLFHGEGLKPSGALFRSPKPLLNLSHYKIRMKIHLKILLKSPYMVKSAGSIIFEKHLVSLFNKSSAPPIMCINISPNTKRILLQYIISQTAFLLVLLIIFCYFVFFCANKTSCSCDYMWL